MVERQGDVDPVVGFGAGRPGEAAHVELGAHVIDPRGLRQAGGAAGEDEQSRVGRGHPRAERCAADAVHRRAEAAPWRSASRSRPASSPRRRRSKAARVEASATQMRGAGKLEAMRQGLAGQLVVDQGGDDAQLGKAKPERQVFEPVGQQDGDPVAPPQPLPFRPGGIAIGKRIELAIGEFRALEADRQAVWPAVDSPLQIVSDEVRRCRCDGPHAQEGPDQAREVSAFPCDRLHRFAGPSRPMIRFRRVT